MQQAQPQWIIRQINERYISNESALRRSYRHTTQVLCRTHQNIMNYA